ncbi:MAG: S1C family serine protease [Solirubrobacteraceae bacterium]
MGKAVLDGTSVRRRTQGRGFAFPVAVLSAIAIAACGGSTTHQQSVTSAATTKTVTASPSAAASDALASLVAKTRSAIVRIEANVCGGEQIGTGFLIAPRLVATVAHAVHGAASIDLKQGGKVVASGTVIGEDQARDVALVQSSVPLTAQGLHLAARAPELGESVAALGFPLGLPLTVTQGSVSGLDRAVPIDGLRRRQMVQTDAAVNPGNSGGPLLSVDTGQVLGLVDLGTNSANGIGFAVSARVAQPLIQAWKVAPQPVPVSTCPSGGTTPIASAPPNSTASSTAAAAVGPAATLRLHLEDLASGQYDAAFNLMSSGYRAQNPSWVQDRAAAEPGVNVISTGSPQYGSGRAQVPVDFYARDGTATQGSDTKCREFTGTASMVLEDGVWRCDPSANKLSGSVVPASDPNCP